MEQNLLVENQATLDFLEQLKQKIVNILLLDAIKEVPVYTKAIKEAYTKYPSRKKKDYPCPWPAF